MTDDIVTRLRNIAALRGNLGGNIIPFACVEAADEIERLREQVKALVHEWELSERGVHCEHKEVRGEI